MWGSTEDVRRQGAMSEAIGRSRLAMWHCERRARPRAPSTHCLPPHHHRSRTQELLINSTDTSSSKRPSHSRTMLRCGVATPRRPLPAAFTPARRCRAPGAEESRSGKIRCPHHSRVSHASNPKPPPSPCSPLTPQRSRAGMPEAGAFVGRAQQQRRHRECRRPPLPLLPESLEAASRQAACTQHSHPSAPPPAGGQGGLRAHSPGNSGLQPRPLQRQPLRAADRRLARHAERVQAVSCRAEWAGGCAVQQQQKQRDAGAGVATNWGTERAQTQRQ